MNAQAMIILILFIVFILSNVAYVVWTICDKAKSTRRIDITVERLRDMGYIK